VLLLAVLLLLLAVLLAVNLQPVLLLLSLHPHQR
jgi:hypothetical protein